VNAAPEASAATIEGDAVATRVRLDESPLGESALGGSPPGASVLRPGEIGTWRLTGA
jgi:hypothetical protein